MKAALVISDRDNVATALQPLASGRQLELGGGPVTTREDIPSGHKVALARIPAGAPVVKYGSSIGVASQDIEIGEHVHTHNLSSTRGRGDIGAQAAPPAPRLAEPPDEPSGEPAGSSAGVPPALSSGEAAPATHPASHPSSGRP